MAGSDHIQISALEKARSSDVVDLQALQARTLSMLLKHWFESRLGGAAANDFQQHPLVNGCLVQGLGANSVTVSPGFLCQVSDTITPTPGTYDSNYRIALNMSPLVVTTPSPGSTTFYLLEARMTEQTTNSSREVLNTGTQTFVNQLVPKWSERVLQTQWVAGTTTNFPTPTGGDWVVLAGVRVATGGGPVAASDVYDMRIQPDLLVGEAYVPRARGPLFDSVEADLAASTAVINFDDVLIPAGTTRTLRGYARQTAGEVWNVNDIETGLVLMAADTWYYVYLSHYNGLLPRLRRTGVRTRGTLFLSTTAPAAFSRLNGGSVTPLPPFAGFSVPAGQAVCVGILRSHSIPNTLRAIYGTNGKYRFGRHTASALQVASGAATATLAVGAGVFPVGPRILKLRVRIESVTISGPPTVAQYFQLDIRRAGDGSNSYSRWTVPGPAATTMSWYQELDVPYDGAGYDVQFFNVGGGGTITGGTIYVDIIGWEW